MSILGSIVEFLARLEFWQALLTIVVVLGLINGPKYLDIVLKHRRESFRIKEKARLEQKKLASALKDKSDRRKMKQIRRPDK